VSSPYLDAINGCKYTSATVPDLEYYYPKYSRDPRCNWDEHTLVEQHTELPSDMGVSNTGCEKCVSETG
jgi:hypothetical protein